MAGRAAVLDALLSAGAPLGLVRMGTWAYAPTIDPAGTVLSLTLIGKQYAEPGTEVSVVWGEHPGPGTPADADLGFPPIRAVVRPAPFDDHARNLYRRSL